MQVISGDVVRLIADVLNEYPQVIIHETGSLCSTTTPTVEAVMKHLGVTKQQAEELIPNAHENQWPEGINALEKRNQVRPIMNTYCARLVGELPGIGYVLLIAVKDNIDIPKMPADMVPKHDIFFIMRDKAGFSLKK